MPARSIDRVTISFGLVSIPTKVYTTSEASEDLTFHWLHAKDGARLHQQYVCAKDGEVVERDQMMKGYEYAKGKYVPITKEELKALEESSSNTIALEQFVPAALVDPLYFERSYYLGPDTGGDHAYALLSRAMSEGDLVGIASYAARGKAYIVVVRPYQNGMVMHQLRYPDEIKSWDEVPHPEAPRIKEAELTLARQLIAQVASDEFDPGKYHDTVKERVMAALARKRKGGELLEDVEEAPRAEFTDLMAALKASLGGKGDHPSERARAPRRAAARTRAHPARAKPARKHARTAHR